MATLLFFLLCAFIDGAIVTKEVALPRRGFAAGLVMSDVDEVFNGEIFLFRNGSSPWSEPVGFVPLLSKQPFNNTLMRISVVLGAEAQVTSAESLNKLTVIPTPYWFHCKIAGNWSSTLSADFGGVEKAVVSGGVVVDIFVFTDTHSGLQSHSVLPAYEIEDPTTLQGYVLLDGIPGDIDFSPLRNWFTVSTSIKFSSVTELLSSGQVITDTQSTFAVVVGEFNFSLIRGENVSAFANATISEVPVDTYLMPLSAMTTGSVSVSRISVGLLIQIDGQQPVLDSVMGDPNFSFARAIVSLSSSAAITSHQMLSRSSIMSHYTGEIANIEVVSEETSGFMKGWYKNTTVWFRALERMLSNGCELLLKSPAELVQLFRANESSRIKTVFTSKPRELDELGYSPFVTAAWFEVPSSFSSTSATPLVALNISFNSTSEPDWPNTNLFNAPRKLAQRLNVSEETTTFYSVRNATFRFGWQSSNHSSIADVEVSGIDSLHQPLVFGFNGKTPFTGMFIVAYFDAMSHQCVRQFQGSLLLPSGLAEKPLGTFSPTLTRTVVRGGTLQLLGVDLSSNSTLFSTVGVLDIDNVENCNVQLNFSSSRFLEDFLDDRILSMPAGWTANAEKSVDASYTSLVLLGSASTELDVLLESFEKETSTPLPVTSNSRGTFRCDSSFSVSWSVLNSSVNTVELVILPSQITQSLWFGFGVGSSTFVAADVVVVYRSITNRSTAIVKDATCSVVGSSFLCLNHAVQDASAVSANSTAWVVRRPVVVPLRTSQERTGVTNLVSTTIVTTIGFGGDGVSSSFVPFQNTPVFVAQDDAVGVADLYRLRSAADTNGAPDPWPPSQAQLSITPELRYYISRVAPGGTGYSDLRAVIDVFVPVDFVGELPLRFSDLPPQWERRRTNRTVNCPMVHGSTTLGSDVATVATMLTVKFEGLSYNCVAFLASTYSVSTRTQRVFELRSSSTASILNYVFELVPSSVNYTSFCHVFSVSVPAALQGALNSAAAIISSGLPLLDTQSFVNFPVVSTSSTPAPTSVTAPSVEATYGSLFQHQQRLYSDNVSDQQLLLLWNYDAIAMTVDVALLAKNINGYISVGFSSTSSLQMTDADIVLGYINSATLEGCVRVLYSAFPTSAPSAAATLQIRSSAIQRSGDYLILSFSRDFDGGAHAAGVIPAPSATGVALGRILFATMTQYVSASCVSTEFGSLYHGSSPHGSSQIDWAAAVSSPTSTSFPTTASPASTGAPTISVLLPYNIQSQPVFVRGILSSMICSQPSFPVATVDGEHPEFPPVYQFLWNNSVVAAVLPLISTFPQLTGYSGSWRIHYVNLSSSYASALSIPNITSYSALESVVNVSLAAFPTDLYWDCPVISALTSAPSLTKRVVFFNGQAITCLEFSQPTTRPNTKLSSSPVIASMWNTSLSVIVDDTSTTFFRIVRVNTTTGANVRAEDVASLPSASSGGIMQCKVIVPPTPQNRSVTLSLVPSSLPIRTGYFGNKTVTFVSLPSLKGGRCANPQSGWAPNGVATLFLLRNLSRAGVETSLDDINLTSLSDLVVNTNSMVPILSIRVSNSSVGFINRTTTVLNATSNITSNITIQDPLFAELITQSLESSYFVDSVPIVNETTYCDGVWRVVVVDVSSLNTAVELNVTTLNATFSNGTSNATATPAWRNGDFVPSSMGGGWYAPWWADINVLRALPQRTLGGTLLGSRLHCPLIHKDTTLEGGSATMQRLSVMTVGGFVADCLNFGWLNEAAANATLPSLVNASSAGSFALDAIPGSRWYSSIFWARELRGVSQVPSTVNASLLVAPSYQTVYVFVVSVSGSSQPGSTSSLVLWNLTMAGWNWATQGRQVPIGAASRASSDPLGSFALTKNFSRASSFPLSAARCLDRESINCTSAVIGKTLLASSLTVMHVFRRGTTLGSPSVMVTSTAGAQRAVVLHTPLQSYYHASNGSWGYTDLKRLVVVTVPTSYSGPEITSVSRIPSSWIQTNVTTVVGHSFLHATAAGVTQRTPSTSGQAMWCPQVGIWAGDSLWSSVDCGYGPSPVASAVDVVSIAGTTTMAPPRTSTLLFVGSNVTAVASVAPLHIDNLNLKLAYSVAPNISGYRVSTNSAFVKRQSTPMTQDVQLLMVPMQFSTMLPESGFVMNKFVFRSGAALSSSRDLAPPIITWNGMTDSMPSVSRVFIVNVGSGFSSAELYDMEITTEFGLRAAAVENGWPILDTFKVEAGVVLHIQSNISNAELAAMQSQRLPKNRLEVVSVFVDGVPRLQIASRILVEQHAGRTTLTPRALQATDGSMFLSAAVSAGWLPFVHVSTPVGYTTFSDRLQLLGSIDTLISLVETSPVVDAGAMLVQIVGEAYAPYVTPPAARGTLARQTTWFQGEQTAAYIFDDRSIANPNRPSPLYVFRRLSANGAVLATTGAPLIDALPGHASYNDLHEIVYCDLPSTSSALAAPTSIRALRLMANQGVVQAPQKSGVIKLTPIVGAGTTVETQDLAANGGSVLGPSAVVYEGTTLAMLDFGITKAGMTPDTSVATRLLYQLNSLPVPGGWILNSVPWANTSYAFVRRAKCTTVPNWILPNTVTSDAAAADIAVANTSTTADICGNNISVAVVARISSSAAAEDANISTTGPTLISWAYGPLNYSNSTGIVTRGAPTRTGGGTIDFFEGNVTGSAAVSDDWVNITNGSTTLILGEAVTLSWQLGTSAATTTAGRGFDALDTSPVDIATYAPTELYAQFKLTVTADVWVGLGLTQSGGMSGADMWIAYASQSVPAGGVATGSFSELSDRHADPSNAYNTPIRDPVNDLELLSLELTSSGYVIVFRRRLVTGDTEYDIAIQNTLQTMIWAYGPYALNQETPGTHTDRGMILVNLFTGQNIAVQQRTFTFWYVAMLIGACVLLMLVGFLARLLAPGYLMYKRPLLFVSVSTGVKRMTIAELLVWWIMWGVGAAWGYGAFTNFDVSRRADAEILALGSTAQFLLYFGLLPTARNNVLITGVFRSSWHKLQHWVTLMLLPGLVLSWVHGGIMMYRRPDLSFHTTSGVCSIVGLSLLTLLYLVWHSSDLLRRRILRPLVSLRRQHSLYIVVTGAAVALLCMHTPKLALGWIPWFLLFASDHLWRWKDFTSRFGTVVAQGAFGSIAAAFELRIYSPWKNWWTRAFVVSAPGQFVLLAMENVEEGPFAVSISSRVLQDPKLNFASATFHVKPPSAGARSRVLKDRETYLGARERIRRLAAGQHLRGRFCRVEGPYGGIGLRLKWYRSLLLVGGGIGASTCLSLLEAMTFQPDYYAQDTCVETVTLVLVAKEPEELAIFAAELFELLSAPRPFDLQLLLHCTSPTYHQPASAPVDGNFHSLVDVASPPRRATAPPAVLSNPSELHPLFEHVPIFFHRPNWARLLSSEQIAAGKRKEQRLAVHVNGPPSLTAEVLETCDILSDYRGVQIHVDYELYDMCV